MVYIKTHVDLFSQYASEKQFLPLQFRKHYLSVLTYYQKTTFVIFQKTKMKEIDETDYDCINGVRKRCLHCLNYKNECNCPRWRKICVNVIEYVEEKNCVNAVQKCEY